MKRLFPPTVLLLLFVQALFGAEQVTYDAEGHVLPPKDSRFHLDLPVTTTIGGASLNPGGGSLPPMAGKNTQLLTNDGSGSLWTNAPTNLTLDGTANIFQNIPLSALPSGSYITLSNPAAHRLLMWDSVDSNWAFAVFTGAGVSYDHSSHTFTFSGGGGGGGTGDVVGPVASVDSEVALYSGTGGKTLKRATGSGIAKLTSGVLSTGAAFSDLSGSATDAQIPDGITLGANPVASYFEFTNIAAPSTPAAGKNRTYIE